MPVTPLRPHYKFRANVRPIKYAYFIPEDDYGVLGRVIQNACTQWGGVRSLLIPVRPDITIDPLYVNLLKLHEPDRFVSYIEGFNTKGHPKHNALIRQLLRLLPNNSVQLENGDVFDKGDESIHPLGVIPDEEPQSRKLVSYVFDDSSPDSSLLLALFGRILPQQWGSYTQAFDLELRPIAIPPASHESSAADSDEFSYFWNEQLNLSPFSSILNLTSYGIAPYRSGSGFESPRFNVVPVSSVDSLCLYWDIRATREATQIRPKLGRRTLLLPEQLLRNNAAIESLIAFVRAHIRFPNFRTDRHIHFNVVDEGLVDVLRATLSQFERLEETYEASGYEGFTGGGGPESLLEVDEVHLKYGFRLPSYSGEGFVGTYYEGAKTSLPLNAELGFGHNELRYEPPQGFRNKFRQLAVMDFDCDVWSRYPRDFGIANKIRHSARFTRYGVSYLTFPPATPAHVEFYLPDEWEALETYFTARGYGISLSTAGRYGNAVIDLVGGLSDVSILSTKAAYRLLDALTFRSTKKIGQQILKQIGIPDDLMSKLEPLTEERLKNIIEGLDLNPELRRVTKTYAELTGGLKKPDHAPLLALIEQLSSNGVIKRGFTLKCPNCGTPSWYPLEIIKEEVTCLGCSHVYPLPVRRAEGHEIQWEYTLNTLVNRMMDQDALVHILALHHLAKGKEISCAVPGLLLNEADSTERHVTDFDFIFISNHEFFAGECKAGTELGDKDFETARLASEIGIQHFYYCTAKSFSDITQQKISELKSDLKLKQPSMSLEVLTGETLLM
jgi:hypothetical protein